MRFSRSTMAFALVLVVLATTSCQPKWAEEVAHTYGTSTDEAIRIVEAASTETRLSQETAAAKLIDAAQIRVAEADARVVYASWLDDLTRTADEAFGAAIASTFCEATLTALSGQTPNPSDLFASMAQTFTEEVANHLWNAGWILAAVNSVQELQESDPTEVSLVLAEIRLC